MFPRLRENGYFMLYSGNINNQIFQKLNCKSGNVLHLMECTMCNEQYVEKAETAFNIRLSNHRTGVKDSNALIACKHF